MRISLRTLLTLLFAGLLLAATATVGLNSLRATQAALEVSWHQHAASLAEQASAETAVWLAGARPVAHQADALARAGVLDIADLEGIADYGVDVLRANPHHTWFSWTDQHGNLAAALRWPQPDGSERIRRDIRLVQDDGVSWHRQWEEQPEGWVLVQDRSWALDLTTEDWYLEGLATGARGGWLDPYIFKTRQQAGITFAQPALREGVARGVWTSDFECAPLSRFLATLAVGQTGKVYVLTTDGHVVGHPQGLVADAEKIWTAQDHPDPWLKQAWTQFDGQAGAFAMGDLLAAAHPFPATSGLPWTVLVVVPRAELYGEADAQLRRSIAITGGLLLLALVLGLTFARHLAGAVRGVEKEMDRIARFELDDTTLGDEGSVFSEVQALGEAHDRMKGGLRSFARYVPQQLVAQLMRSGGEAQVGAEERVATVLFCDIAGFTTIVEATPPQTLLAALSEYMTAMDEAISATDGTVAQYLGDAIMAVWNAPGEQADHAERAVRAGLEMKARAQALIDQTQAKGFPPFHTRFGIHTGPCIVGNVGAQDRFSYTVVGDGVRHAERMEQACKTHGVELLISGTTAALVKHRFKLREVEDGVFEVLPD